MSSISETSIICAKYLSEECINFSLLWEPLLTSSLLLSILFSMTDNLSVFGAKFVRGHYLFQGAVFRDRSSRRTLSFEEQIMSKDKYRSIFLRQMEAIVFIIFQIFFTTRTVLNIGEYPRIFPSFSLGIFGHMTRFDQSRASENIWWIISCNIAAVNCF